MFRSDQAQSTLCVYTALEVARLAESPVETHDTLKIVLGEWGEPISNEDAQTIALSLPKLKFPVIRVELLWGKQNSFIKTLAEACKECSAQIELLIHFATSTISAESVIQCVKAISDSNISLFSLKDDFLLTPPVVNALFEVLQTGNRHRGPFSLDVSWSSIGDEGVIAFARALKSGRCAPHLDINIAGTEFGTKGITALIEALKSEHCPSDLTLRFGSQTINNLHDIYSLMKLKNVLALVEVLCSKECPRNLTLAFSRKNFILHNFFTGQPVIDHSIEGVRALTMAAVQNPSLFIIGIDPQQENSEFGFSDHLAKEMQVISLCNRRNQLIKAHPILQLVYINMSKSPFTLKDYCLFAVAKRADKTALETYNIPNELREELMELKGILSELASLLTKIGMNYLVMQPRENDNHDVKATLMLGMS